MEGQRGCSSSNSRVFNSKLTLQHSTETSTLSLETLPTLETELRVVNKIVGAQPSRGFLWWLFMETRFLCWVTFLSRKRWAREEGGGCLSHDSAALDCDMRSFSSVSHYWLLIAIHSLSPVWLFSTPWTAARQASLSFTIFPELAQTHVYWVSDAIQPSYSLSHPCPPALNLSQHQGLFQWVSSSHQVPKVLEV